MKNLAAIIAAPIAAILVWSAPAEGTQLPAALSLPQAFTTPEQTVSLRPVIEVTADVIRLGDLFDGPVGQPETPVARAPAPGETASFGADWVAGIAQAYGISWSPLNASSHVSVKRTADWVGRTEIIAALRDVLAGRGTAADSDIEIDTQLEPVAVPAGGFANVSVGDLSHDPRSGRFSAFVHIPGSADQSRRQRISGRIHTIVEVPVATRPLGRSDMLSETDVEWMRIRADRLPAGVVTDPSQIVGMAAKRALRAGEPLRLRDLERPSLVDKGQTVTMVLKTPFMTLTAQGRALDDGAKGDSVRIQNMQTRKTVLATVADQRLVVVDHAVNAASTF
jgi:flagella basal body P-ring formation protein FlgA